jgi:hypothetical protein
MLDLLVWCGCGSKMMPPPTLVVAIAVLGLGPATPPRDGAVGRVASIIARVFDAGDDSL